MTEGAGRDETMARLWMDALEPVRLRHPNPSARPAIEIVDGPRPMLRLSISNHRDTAEPGDSSWASFTISNVELTFFPGERLARAWLAAAWAGYIQHEALELATVDGKAVLDPHAEPYRENPWNRGLRDGLPVVLTRDTLISALSVVMDRDHAIRLVEAEHG